MFRTEHSKVCDLIDWCRDSLFDWRLKDLGLKKFEPSDVDLLLLTGFDFTFINKLEWTCVFMHLWFTELPYILLLF